MVCYKTIRLETKLIKNFEKFEKSRDKLSSYLRENGEFIQVDKKSYRDAYDPMKVTCEKSDALYLVGCAVIRHIGYTHWKNSRKRMGSGKKIGGELKLEITSKNKLDKIVNELVKRCPELKKVEED